jgi:hypothetical protein
LNARLEAACLADLDRKASGQSETFGPGDFAIDIGGESQYQRALGGCACRD